MKSKMVLTMRRAKKERLKKKRKKKLAKKQLAKKERARRRKHRARERTRRKMWKNPRANRESLPRAKKTIQKKFNG